MIQDRIFRKGEVVSFRWYEYFRVMVVKQEFSWSSEVLDYTREKKIKWYQEIDIKSGTTGTPEADFNEDLFIDWLEENKKLEQVNYTDFVFSGSTIYGADEIGVNSPDRIGKY